MTDNVVTLDGKPVQKMSAKQDILDTVAQSLDAFGAEDVGILYVLLHKDGRYKVSYNALNTEMQPHELRAIGTTTLAAYTASFIPFDR